jgi:hypothetical protein
MKFKCHCDFHIIDVDITPLKFKGVPDEDYIGITIYNHISMQTGKKFKKPIEEGTVTLIGEEARKFRNFIDKMTLKINFIRTK